MRIELASYTILWVTSTHGQTVLNHLIASFTDGQKKVKRTKNITTKIKTQIKHRKQSLPYGIFIQFLALFSRVLEDSHFLYTESLHYDHSGKKI